MNEQPITAAKVRSVLQRAGYEKSVLVRSAKAGGYSHWSSGYRVTENEESIFVSYEWGPGMTWATYMQRSRISLLAYLDTLNAAGIKGRIEDREVVIEKHPRAKEPLL